MHTALDGMTVFVSGASGGIGQALVEAFASEGCNLVLHAGRNVARLRTMVEARGLTARALIVDGDVRVPDTLVAAFAAARARFGRVDVVVANAGIWPSEPVPLDAMTIERIREVIEVNLLGVIWTLRAFVALVREQGVHPEGRGASACLIGSTAGRFGESGHAEYAASKAALTGLVLSLKNEIVEADPFARVNMVEPGWTVTPMARSTLEVAGMIERSVATMPLRQLARPQDIARAVLWLSAPALARHVSGQTITVGGGMEGRQLWTPSQVDASAVRARLEPDPWE